jgi:hypothetical protein
MFRFFYGQHNNSIYCGNGSEIFRFYVAHWPLGARCFASCTSTQQYSIVCIVGMEAKHFTSCCSLVFGSELFRFLHVNTTILNGIYCGNGSEIFRFLLPIDCMEARRFASCYPLVTTSEMFRFPGHNIRTNDSLQKSQYIRRNLFAYYA